VASAHAVHTGNEEGWYAVLADSRLQTEERARDKLLMGWVALLSCEKKPIKTYNIL
jgi:hypothetical protein